MGALAEVMDSKFTEAMQLHSAGKNSLHFDSGTPWQKGFEVTGLDCQRGGSQCFRYVIARCSLDAKPIRLAEGVLGNSSDMELTNYFVQIPRMAGDHRAFEDLPPEAFMGQIAMVDGTQNIVAEFREAGLYFLSQVAIHELAQELGSLRVAEQLPHLG